MFTRKRLVRALSSRGGGQQHVSFLERANVERGDHGSRGRAALGAYLAARLVDRILDADGSVADESFIRWQLQTTWECLGDFGGEDLEAAHVRRLLDAIARAPAARVASIRSELLRYSRFLENEDRGEEALDMLRLAAACSGSDIPADEFCELALRAGRLNLRLSRPEQAAEAFLAAGEAAHNASDEAGLLRVRLGETGIARLRGDFARARAGAEGVILDASSRPELETVARDAFAELGAVLERAGRPVDALRAIYEAFCRTTEADERAELLCRLGEGLAALREEEAALAAFDLVHGSEGSRGARLRAVVGSMSIASARGDRVGFERMRAMGAEFAERSSAEGRVRFLHESAVGLARFRQFSRAADAWHEALDLARQHRLSRWERRIERIVGHLDDCRGERVAEPAPAIAADVAPLSAGLRTLAALAGR